MKLWTLALIFVSFSLHAQKTQDSLTAIYPFLKKVFDSTGFPKKGTITYSFHNLSLDTLMHEPQSDTIQVNLRIQFARSYPENKSIIIMEDLDRQQVIGVFHQFEFWEINSNSVSGKRSWVYVQRLPVFNRTFLPEGMLGFHHVFQGDKVSKEFRFDPNSRLLISDVTDLRKGYIVSDTTGKGHYYEYESPRIYKHQFDEIGRVTWASRLILNEKRTHYDSLHIQSRSSDGLNYFELMDKYQDLIKLIDHEIEMNKRSPYYETWFPQIGDTIRQKALETLVKTENEFRDTDNPKLIVFHSGEVGDHTQLMKRATDLKSNTKVDLIYVANSSSNDAISKELVLFPQWASCQIYEGVRLIRAQIPALLILDRHYRIQKVYWNGDDIDWKEVRSLLE